MARTSLDELHRSSDLTRRLGKFGQRIVGSLLAVFSVVEIFVVQIIQPRAAFDDGFRRAVS
jgi:hypothetical protein